MRKRVAYYAAGVRYPNFLPFRPLSPSPSFSLTLHSGPRKSRNHYRGTQCRCSWSASPRHGVLPCKLQPIDRCCRSAFSLKGRREKGRTGQEKVWASMSFVSKSNLSPASHCAPSFTSSPPLSSSLPTFSFKPRRWPQVALNVHKGRTPRNLRPSRLV